MKEWWAFFKAYNLFALVSFSPTQMFSFKKQIHKTYSKARKHIFKKQSTQHNLYMKHILELTEF